MSAFLSKNVIDEGTVNYFYFGSSLTPYFEIGQQSGTEVWLEGALAGPEEEFVFNGRLFVPGHHQVGTVIDNFPVGPAPAGWFIRKHVDNDGYDLVRPVTNEVLFGYIVRGNMCYVTTNLYSQSGKLVVRATSDGLEISGIALKLGHHGILMAA